MERIYHIHAGAHRTGTSSFQLCLHVNRGLLRQAGFDVAYPGRDGIPSGRLSLPLPSPRHGYSQQAKHAERVRRSVAEHAKAPGGQMILSEENIPGRMLHFFEGRFYPAAEARADALAQGLGGRVGTLLFVVRDYAELYRSAWRKRAEDKPQPTFASQTQNLLAMDRGWPELLAVLQQHLRPERLVVVEYGVRGRSADLLWRLVPGIAGLVEPRRQLNISVTEAALETLQALYAQGTEVSAQDWARIVAQHAQDRAPRGLTEFTPQQQAALQTRYRSDLARLRDMPGVQVVS